MKILNLVQGSPKWIAERLKNFTASEAPVMMGDSKYMSRNELLDLKKSGVSKAITPSTQELFDKGHDAEELARPLAELVMFEELKPLVGVRVVDGLGLLASFDGINDDFSVAWEHKLWNQTLAENVRKNVLEAHYYWQLEHQMLVADIEEITFNVSDGTTDNNESMTYFSVPERRESLIAGWKQFAIDLEKHEVKAKVEPIKAKEIQALPTLEISLIGQVNNSNLAEYKSTALAFITSIRTDLQTDQDFKDAGEAIKFLKNGEDELENVKTRALSQTEDIKVLFETIDHLKEEMRQKRLTLNKLTKSEKERIRHDIAKKAGDEFIAFVNGVNKELAPFNLFQLTSFESDFNAPMKGKSTVESLQNSVDTKLAQLKIEVNEIAEKVTINLASLKELAGEYKFLFNDTYQIILKDNEDLVNLIKSRIAEHEKQEKIKAEEQRKAIQAEEERKAQAKVEAEQKAIADKKAALEAEEEVIRTEQSKKARIPSNTHHVNQEEETALNAPCTDEDKESLPGLSEVSAFLFSLHEIDLNDFAYLLLSNDARHEAEALQKIKANFTQFLAEQHAA